MIHYLETGRGVPLCHAYDLSKAQRLLGFAPRCDIARMIEDAAAFRAGADIGVLPTG